MSASSFAPNGLFTYETQLQTILIMIINCRILVSNNCRIFVLLNIRDDKMKKVRTLKEKITLRISLKDYVFLRDDFNDLGGYDQVGRAL